MSCRCSANCLRSCCTSSSATTARPPPPITSNAPIPTTPLTFLPLSLSSVLPKLLPGQRAKRARNGPAVARTYGQNNILPHLSISIDRNTIHAEALVSSAPPRLCPPKHTLLFSVLNSYASQRV